MHILLSYAEKFRNEKYFEETVKKLREKLAKSDESFVGMRLEADLPPPVKSMWVFALKKETSIPHYHPNSVQHTIVIEGKGKVKIGECLYPLLSLSQSKEKSWCIIEKGEVHEFFPDEEMVVISFHTCPADELMEIKESGEKRKYI